MNQVTKIEDTQQQALAPADPYISMIERVAMDPNADVSKLATMLELQERHKAQKAKSEADLAFAKASAEFPEIPLNGENKHNKTSYALLKDIIGKTRPVLAKYGLALSFSTEVTQEAIIVTAELSHEGGHTRTNSLPLPRDTGAGRNAVQAVGSSQTYGQRYTAQAILGLSLGEDDEDDGVSATGATITPEQFIELRDALDGSGMDPVKFHKAFGHNSPESAMLEQFPAARFDEAIQRLAAYKKARKND